MVKVQYNPSTGKVSYNAVTGKVQVFEDSFLALCCGAISLPTQLKATFSDVISPSGCYEELVFSGSYNFSSFASINGDHTVDFVSQSGPPFECVYRVPDIATGGTYKRYSSATDCTGLPFITLGQEENIWIIITPTSIVVLCQSFTSGIGTPGDHFWGEYEFDIGGGEDCSDELIDLLESGTFIIQNDNLNGINPGIRDWEGEVLLELV